MKRYSLDGILQTRCGLHRNTTVLMLLCCTTPAIPAPALLQRPHVLRVADPATDDSGVLSPAEVQQGLRIRVQDLDVRHQMRTGDGTQSDAPRDYRLDQPPPDADVPLPSDATGGDVFEERLERMP
jgi:hypothetical protein